MKQYTNFTIIKRSCILLIAFIASWTVLTGKPHGVAVLTDHANVRASKFGFGALGVFL